MPNYKGHLWGAAIFYGVILFCFFNVLQPSFSIWFEWLLCMLVGSLFPDVDTKSKGQKYFYHFMLLVFIFLIIQQYFVVLAGCSLISILPLLIPHRGLFHRVWFIIFISSMFWYCMYLLYPAWNEIIFFDCLFFALGALSHILLDFQLYKIFPRRFK